MKASLRAQLLISIIATTSLAWGLAAYRSYRDTRHEINELFDSHLAESAHAILRQAEHERHEQHHADSHKDDDGDDEEDYKPVRDRATLLEKRLYFQLRNAAGQLLTGSNQNRNTPPLSGNKSDGFSNSRYRNEDIRVFSLWNQHHTLNVQVAESMVTRQTLIDSSVRNVLTPILLMIGPLLILLIIAIEWALAPIRRLSTAVQRQAADDLTAINLAVPREILPLVVAINNLLMRIQRTLANERRFTADAAHELRTPLAAIKVQAQVALKSQDDRVARDHALRGVSQGVDRATHLVEQLLTLARLDPEAPLVTKRFQLNQLLIKIISDLAPTSAAKNLELSLDCPEAIDLQGNEAMLAILFRNLIDNAIRYTPAHGWVRIKAEKFAAKTSLTVEDNGTGMTQEQLAQVTQRFARMSRPSGEGSGLGLSIALRIAELHRARLGFAPGESGKGLRVNLVFDDAQ